MKNQFKITPITALLSLLFAIPVTAANVSLTASDGFGSSSFNSAGHWSDGQAPSAANDYFTSSFFMRTPPTDGTYTFAGHSLTLQPPSGQGSPMRSIIVKSYSTMTIDNLTNSGGIINCGNGNGLNTFQGNAMYVISNSTFSADQGPLTFNYPIFGSADLTNNGGGGRTITLGGDNSAFTGRLIITDVHLALTSTSGAPGNPAVMTPDQISLGGAGVLVDSAGITFNNANGGITLTGNGEIDSGSATVVAEPITDNGGGFSLTIGGAGTVTLSGANNYSGGTVISSGTLKIGAPSALPAGAITDNGALDLNGLSITLNSLSGSGTVDNSGSGASVVTVGANGGSGSLAGAIFSSVGTVSLTKVGSGTQTLAGGYTYTGTTLVAGGTLNLDTASGNLPYSTAGDLVVSNGAVLGVDASTGNILPAGNLVVGTNSTLKLNPYYATDGIDASGSLTLQDNSTISVDYGTLTANPSSPAINVSGGISAPGANITINVSAVGLQPATITLIKYTGTALPNLANFNLTTTPGVFATLVNNTGNNSIDLNVTAVSKQLAWYGANGANWNLTSVNWKDSLGLDAIYQQYTNGSVIAGDGVRLDDYLTNDFVNPQPTNINITGMFSPYPLVVDSTLPYSLGGAGGIAGSTSLVKSNTASLTLLTSNSYTGGTFIYGGSIVVTNDNALGAAGAGVTLSGGTLAIAGNTTSSRPITTTVASSIDVASNVTAQLDGVISAVGTLTKTDGGTLALSAANAINGGLSINGGAVSINGGSLSFTGNPSYVGYLNGNGALNLSGSSTLNSSGELRVGGSDQSGTTYDANGTVTMSGGTAYLSAVTLARGNNFENSCSGTLTVSGGTLWSTNDFLAGFAGTGTGTLNISGTGTVNHGLPVTRWFILGRYDTSQGHVNVSGGNLNLMNGTSIKFSSGGGGGTNVFTLSGGAVTFYSDGGTNVGGNGDLNLAQSGSATANNTFNLDGGLLVVPQIGSASSTPTRVFNFNGGTIQAVKDNANFMNLGGGNAVANVRNGGAIIDDGGFGITIAQALVHSTVAGDNATDGGLTKNGTGTLTLSGANSYTGNTAVNAGSLLTTTASTLTGGLMISNNATFSIVQVGAATDTMGNLTMNGGGATPGATLGLALTADNNLTVPFVNCGTLTLNGNNTISLAGAIKVGTFTLIKATGAIAGSGSITNLVLPQGAEGTISVNFDGSFTTVSAVITSTGPGLVWTGTDSVSPNVWDINTSTNWLLGVTPTTYQQTIVPGDAVTFNDSGSGTVILSSSFGPASLVISNNSTSYTFQGSGTISGPTGLQKLGSGTAVLNLTNNNYAKDTTISGGTLQLGSAAALPSAASLTLAAGGTLELAGFSQTVGELTGAGKINNNSGIPTTLTIGTSSGGIWNGTITNSGGAGVALQKMGSGTWVVGGNNYLNNAQPFSDRDLINEGTVIITNGGMLNISDLELRIADGSSYTGAVVVAGGTLIVTNNPLSIGANSATANGTLTVNSGTVITGTGSVGGAFAGSPNNIVIGANGATGTLIVNGGQVLNNHDLWLGQNTGANASFYLNGGLVQAANVAVGGTAPASAIAYFNGGTLRAATNSADFITGITANIMGNGLVLDDGGFTVSIVSVGLQPGDGNNGGVVKAGSGSVYLDSYSTYTGTTVVSNGFLAGAGSITGPVVVQPAGNIGAGDAAGIGSIYLYSDLTLQGKATLRITKDGGSPYGDQVIVTGAANYGGTLVVTNITTDGTPLADGDSFTLFSAGGNSGNFASIVGSPGAGLAYSFDPTTGALTVKTSTIANNPTNITWSVSSGNLSLSWPADHLGWILQSQTNNLDAGLGTNWTDIAGSDAVTNESVTIDSANPSVFYRLRHP